MFKNILNSEFGTILFPRIIIVLLFGILVGTVYYTYLSKGNFLPEFITFLLVFTSPAIVRLRYSEQYEKLESFLNVIAAGQKQYKERIPIKKHAGLMAIMDHQTDVLFAFAAYVSLMSYMFRIGGLTLRGGTRLGTEYGWGLLIISVVGFIFVGVIYSVLFNFVSVRDYYKRCQYELLKKKRHDLLGMVPKGTQWMDRAMAIKWIRFALALAVFLTALALPLPT